MSERIKVGDHVVVYWEYAPVLRGKVIYEPYERGDPWTIEKADGKICYVQNFCRMDKQ